MLPNDLSRWQRMDVRDMAEVITKQVRTLLDQDEVTRTYRRYAPFYDLVFGPAFHFGRKRTVEQMNKTGGARVLEIGVGTGLSLPDYERSKIITGIDVSDEMLRRADRRVKEEGLRNVAGLLRMDAEQLGFADNTFDEVVAMFVMSVVPNPRQCLAEMQRVCRPEGRIVICNHFANGGKSLLKWSEGLSGWLGWRPAFCLGDLFDHTPHHVVSNSSVPPFSLFRLIELRNTA